MKKFFVCTICRDVHYGEKAPEICPTCGIKNAYTEITKAEARKIIK